MRYYTISFMLRLIKKWPIFILLTFLISCEEDLAISDPELNSALNLPRNTFDYVAFSQPVELADEFTSVQSNEPSNNPITNDGATLGRVLFYDKNLSQNNLVSCSSCHIQAFSFSDTAKLSLGFEGKRTGRHSMSLINAKYYYSGRFFWDERATSLEEQVLMPIQDDIEMGMNLDSLVLKLSKLEYYPTLFKNAFGDEVINKERISMALAQFVRSIVGSQTRYHLAKKGHNENDDFSEFTELENLGKKIFNGSKTINCSGCHSTQAFVADIPRNNGIADLNLDLGAYGHQKIEQYKAAFKAPSLVNVAQRAPYMHNGIFKSLEEVIEHYNSGIFNNHGDLDNHLVDGNGDPMRMQLNDQEKEALKAFLLTLTDDNITNHTAFSDPFKK